MNCKSIMVVEDDEDIRKSVVKALTVEGYHVITAENGKVALNLLKTLTSDELPGCIILDLMMPEMDGKTFMDVIDKHHHEDFGHIKILIATAKGSPVNPESIPRAIERIQKPFDLNELFDAIEEHCGKP